MSKLPTIKITEAQYRELQDDSACDSVLNQLIHLADKKLIAIKIEVTVSLQEFHEILDKVVG